MRYYSKSKKLAERYSRQTLLPEIGPAGQRRLSESTAVVIGIGALGCMIANNLARVGVGKIRLVDRDQVELSNLHRQSLFDENDIGKPKAMVAARKLKKINSDIQVEAILKDVNFSNIEPMIISEADVVVDGTDNMETRFLVNDACVKHDIPWIYGGAISTYGMTMTIIPHKTPCLRCFIHNIPGAGALPTCDRVGVLNAIPTIIGSIESVEALKILLRDPGADIENDGINKNLIIYDVWNHEFQSVRMMRDKNCKCCGEHDFEFLNIKKRAIVTSLCGRNAVQVTPIQKGEISLTNLAGNLKKLGQVSLTKFTLTFEIDKYELTIFEDGRAMIKGTNDDRLAKSLYAKYIGT